jgi:DNA-binding SARP family transcriptional activator
LDPPIAIRLCGPLRIERSGREIALPGRQGRLVPAFLTVNRPRAAGRDELLDLLWPDQPPAEPGEALSAILSRVRRALGPAVLPSGRQVELLLPAGAYVDLDVAADALARAEAAADPEAAAGAAEECLRIAGCGFLTGDEDAPWVQERRRDVEALRLRALEALATAALALGGARLAAAEDAARALVEAAPFRESAHCLLMSALEARGDVAEALRAYDVLRLRLRDELGTAPGVEAQAIHRRLLEAGGPEPEPPAPAPPPHEERKLVTVLAATLAGADPEDLRAALHRAAEVAGWFGAAREPGRSCSARRSPTRTTPSER